MEVTSYNNSILVRRIWTDDRFSYHAMLVIDEPNNRDIVINNSNYSVVKHSTDH